MASWRKSYGRILLRGTTITLQIWRRHTNYSKLEATLVDDPEEVLFGNVGGDKGGRVNNDSRVSGGRETKCGVTAAENLDT